MLIDVIHTMSIVYKCYYCLVMFFQWIVILVEIIYETI